MSSTSEIISDAEIERVHANAQFGDMPKRDVVDDGVLQFVFGYDTGHTQMTILREHGLLRASRPRSYRADLSAKGKDYLRAMFRGADYRNLLAARSTQY
jgi:hypothetical protein